MQHEYQMDVLADNGSRKVKLICSCMMFLSYLAFDRDRLRPLDKFPPCTLSYRQGSFGNFGNLAIFGVDDVSISI